MKKQNSIIIDLVAKGLAKATRENTLKTFGDRRFYVGSSDISGCPFKVVSSKLLGDNHDLKTLIRFRRGDMSESIIADAYSNIEENFPGYKAVKQHQAVHPDYSWMQAHIDFLIYNDKFAKIIECKSCSGIPKEARQEWEIQINWQLGLVKADIFNGQDINLSASILSFDLNAGEVAEFGDFTFNYEMFRNSMATAKQIMTAVEANDPSGASCRPSGLCASYCSFKKDCPQFKDVASCDENRLQHVGK